MVMSWCTVMSVHHEQENEMRVHQQHDMTIAESVHAGFGIADFDSEERPRAVVIVTIGDTPTAIEVADADRLAQQLASACAAARGKQVELDA